MSVKGQFLTPLDLRDQGDGEHFMLLGPLEYVSKNGVHYTVPAGFITDLNSSPRWAWRIYPKSNKANRASVIHDYCYDTAIVPKKLADALYEEASEACGVNRFVRWSAFKAVSWFGKGSWDQHAAARQEFPDDDAA